jgi:hypothetical protein
MTGNGRRKTEKRYKTILAPYPMPYAIRPKTGDEKREMWIKKRGSLLTGSC